MPIYSRQTRLTFKTSEVYKAITGTVTLNGSGFGNVKVLLSYAAPNDDLLEEDNSGEILLEDGGHLTQNYQETITDQNGYFEFANVTNGTYILTAEKNSYTFNPESRTVVVADDNHPDQDFAAEQNTFTVSGAYLNQAGGQPAVPHMMIELKQRLEVPTFENFDHNNDTIGFSGVAFYQTNLMPIPHRLSSTQNTFMGFSLFDNSLTKLADHDRGPFKFAIPDGRYWWTLPNATAYVNRIDFEAYFKFESYPHFQSNQYMWWHTGCCDSDSFWMFPGRAAPVTIVKLNRTTGAVSSYSYPTDPAVPSGASYFKDSVYDSDNNCIWAAPGTAANFCRINCATGDITQIPYVKYNIDPIQPTWPQYIKLQIVGNYVYAYPSCAPYIIRINRTTNALEQLEFDTTGFVHPYGIFNNGIYDEHNYIWLAPAYSPNLVRVDINNWTYHYIPVTGGTASNYSSAAYDKADHVYFAPHGAESLMRVNIHTDEIELFPTGLSGQDTKFSQIYLNPNQDALYLIPGQLDEGGAQESSKIVKVNLFELLDSCETDQNYQYTFSNVEVGDYKLVYNPARSWWQHVSESDRSKTVYFNITVAGNVVQDFSGYGGLASISGTVSEEGN
jgi:hypothetical protein